MFDLSTLRKDKLENRLMINPLASTKRVEL